MVSNFEFLEKDFPVLANFGELAEKYCYSDSNSCLMKLGMIGETIVNLMFTYDRIALPQENTAVARIDTLVREGLLTRDLATILHGLRKVRNKAVHENYSSVTDSKNFLLMAYGMCEWFMQTYGDWSYTHKDFVMPEENAMLVPVDKAAEEKKEAELAKQAEEIAANAPKVAQDERKKQAYKVANQRPKTEAETRFLIDEQLRMVGWEADTENIRYSKGVRPTKGRKLAIAEYPTNSTVGNRGYADYALFIGEKLVGIIEAKAIHKDIPSVIDYQGKDYPGCIREEDEKYVIGKWGEFKVPFTFATNGRPYLEQYKTKSGIWFLDLRKPDNSPMALHGWMSPDGMEELLVADVDSRNKELKEMSYDLLTDKDGLNLRPYQLNAIKAAEEAVISGKQTALLAMATGTGKTRTVLGMIYRFLKTERFRRILFLVDRTALGEQAQDVFEEVKMEDLLTLDDIYNIKGLEDKTIDKETRIHISTVQGMVKRIMYNNGETMPAVSDYDLLIIDECHHAASNTSMELLQKINAKYVYGVSATPKRGDSLDKIIYMLLGPLRHRFTALERAQEQGIGHYFVPRYTRVVDTADSKDDINKAYSLISTSKVRNEMIVNDVIACIAMQQTPVILTRFKEHAKLLYDTLKEEADHVFLLYGDNTDKENADIRVRLKQVPKNESLILVATGQKIGEGFDFPRLDVLMLAAPVSFEGRLEQYVGRLNRDYEGKEAVYVYDYIDAHVRYFNKMYAKRIRTYKKTGFSIWTGDVHSKQVINAIYDSGNYTEKFEQDIVEAEKMIVISSPDIRQDKIGRLLLLVKSRQEKGVNVTVITADPEEVVYSNADVCYELIREMQQVGINVVAKAEVVERFAVIDDELVWHGGMNLLGKVDIWDNLMRIKSHQVAAELLEIALGVTSEP